MHIATLLSTRLRRGSARFLLGLGMLCLGALWPVLASAAPSALCPVLSATVPNGGSVAIDVSACDGLFDGGMSGPIAPFALHGTVSIGVNSGGVQFVTYVHGGDVATSDIFYLEDNDLGVVTVNITITAPASPVVVSPAILPAMTAGTPFTQLLNSSGGAAPYVYGLAAGTLPPGLSLSTGGALSGTPTRRGAYGFTVRSQDSVGAFVDKAYAGTVQSPSLAISPTAATVIQGAPFSAVLAVTGGVAPFTFQLESASFPSGLSISAGGVISGTTSAAPGSYPVTLRVTDASTGVGSYFELEPFTITVVPPPSVSIAVSPASVSEDGASNLVYTVTRSASLGTATEVNIATSGTATAGTDYTGGVATVTILAGATTATITINPTADSTIEPDETVTLTVAAGTGYTVGNPASATGTILNDDAPSASIAVSPAAVAEDGAANLIYTVTLSQSAASPVSVAFTVGGTATLGTDYATIASPLVIPAGSTTGTITVNPTADATIEADETVVITLAAGSGYTVGSPASATGTILNDDLPNLTINDVTASEGNAGTTNFTFTVSLSAPAGPGGVTFDIATANGSATAGVDYVAQSLTAQTIPAGSSSYAFTVQVNGDTLNEPSETFFVNVTNVTNAVLVDAQGVGTIVNDDPLPSLSINDVSLLEGNAGTSTATFTVTLSAASGQTVTVNFGTADGTATQPADYQQAGGTLTFPPGTVSRTIGVTVNGDVVPEANETFFVNLSGAVNATIADNQGVGTILNDDVPVTVSPGSLPGATVAAPYSQTITASGGSGPYTYAVTAGALPAGLTLSPGGALGGTPTAGGTFNFTVTATDGSPFPGPFTGSRAYTLTVAAPTLSLPATTLPAGVIGQAYTGALAAASGGTAPYTYAVTAGALPPNVNLAPATGAITGTPASTGTFNFSVTATDSSTGTGPYTATRAYSIAVNSNVATLGGLALSSGSLVPVFAPETLSYAAGVDNAVASVTVTPTATDAGATVKVNGVVVASGSASGAVALAIGANTITVLVTAQDGTTTRTYTVVVTRAKIAQAITFGPAPTLLVGGTATVSATGGGSGNPVTFSSATPATCNVTGATVAGLALGTCTIAADQAGSTTYEAAPQATQSFPVLCDVGAPGDCDGDGIPNAVEPVEGRDPLLKDNDVFGNARLFTMQQYRDFLSREGEESGIAAWTGLINGGIPRAAVINAFIGSPEFDGFVAPVVRLYFATFLRVPDHAGLAFNVGLVRNGTVTVAGLAEFFAASPEFAATYGSLDDTAFVTLLYNNVLGRAPDPAGLSGWVALLGGGYTRGQVLRGFSDSVEYQASMANEVFVTMLYSGMLRVTPDPSGFSSWVTALGAGTATRAQAIDAFLLAPAYRDRFLP